MNVKVPHLKLSVEEFNLNAGAVRILEKIRPTWEKENLEFKLLTDGITNKLVGCKLKGLPEEDTVLVRVYGHKTDLLIDRKAETRNIILLNSVNLAPRLYATFENGLAYEFVPGCTLTSTTVAVPKIYRLVAQKMALMHKVNAANGASKPPLELWKKLQSFLDLIPDVFTNEEKQKKFQKCIMSKVEIQREVNEMKERLSETNNVVVFAHNDLLLGNIVYTESKNSVTFIDYEYACMNYQAFDIGNHFAEFAGTTNVDYSKYPSKDLQLDWIKVYLTTFKGENNISEEEIYNLYVLVNQFALMSHLFWGIWALIQTEHSYIDFDFLEYAGLRFDEYRSKKDIFLGLKTIS